MLRPHISALTRARNLVQRSHPTCLGSTRTVSTATSSTIPASGRNLRTRYLFLGFGVVSATGYLLYRHKVYSDAQTDWLPRQPDSPAPSGLAPGIRGIACAQTTASGEDHISITYYPFSTTLGYLSIGVYDGHSGSSTVTELSHTLSDAVVGALADLYSKHAQKHAAMDVSSGVYLPAPGALPNPIPPDSEIDDAIRRVFVAVDNTLVHEAAQKVLALDDAAYAALQACNDLDAANALLPAAAAGQIRPAHYFQDAVRTLGPAWSGSCALLGLFNIDDRSLRVALTGDSRAVLGRRVPTADGGYTYEVHALTEDQNANNPAEAARLTALHPDEPELLKNGRTVGWGPSRAFGDGSMKWSRAVQTQLQEKALGDRPRDACKTPPYFTAEPIVSTTREVRRGDFVVFATDGLWDSLTNEEVVGLVGRWLEDHGTDASVVGEGGRTQTVRVPAQVEPLAGSNQGFGSATATATAIMPTTTSSLKDAAHPPVSPTTTPPKTYLPTELPVVFPPSYEDKTTMYKWWRAEKKFICEDELVAVHLMKNALGGANKDLGLALLDMPMPRARKYRDDISIAVIFFD